MRPMNQPPQVPPQGWTQPSTVVIVERPKGPNRLVRLLLLTVLGFVVAVGAYMVAAAIVS